MITIKATVDRLFFDNEKILKYIDAKKRKAFSKAGAFVRRRAQTSIRKNRKTSQPGSPPHSHVGLLRKHIYFAYDIKSKSVFIGPIRLKKGEAPSLLEYGGVRISENGKSLNYRSRPFMRPALEQERKINPAMFLGEIQ